MIKGYNIEIPDNKMHWVFCELSKFKKQHKYDEIDGTYGIKEQWLDFLINASEKVSIPEDLDEIVKRGYNIMKSVLIEEDTRILYWKEKSNKALHEQVQEEKEAEAFQEGELKGLKKGQWEGKVKGEIKLVKSLLKYKVEPKEIANDTKFLGKKKGFEKSMEDTLKDIFYIEQHKDDRETIILGDLDIEYDSDMG